MGVEDAAGSGLSDSGAGAGWAKSRETVAPLAPGRVANEVIRAGTSHMNLVAEQTNTRWATLDLVGEKKRGRLACERSLEGGRAARRAGTQLGEGGRLHRLQHGKRVAVPSMPCLPYDDSRVKRKKIPGIIVRAL